MQNKPKTKPRCPNFSSGPTAKRPGYDLKNLIQAPLGRSHRSKTARERLSRAIRETREFLGIPDDYLVGVVPGSCTGAFEMALWNLVGPRPVDALVYEAFGKTWADDVEKQLRPGSFRRLEAPYGYLPALESINFAHDLVFTWNGTASGVKIPEKDFIPVHREGLTLCDATSAVFAMEIPWDRLDAVSFSWQKVLGGEAAHGMIVLSPRAVERLNHYHPPWPLPKVFRLKKGENLMDSLFAGSTINTPSLLCVEDYLDTLAWARAEGGLSALIRRSEENFAVIDRFVKEQSWIDFLAVDPATRSNTSVCLKVDLAPERITALIALLEKEEAAYDIVSYPEAPPGLRFWCGATVEKEDLAIAMQWLSWAYEQVRS